MRENRVQYRTTASRSKVDRQMGMLSGVIIAQTGEVRGHSILGRPYELDDDFMTALARAGRAFGDVGVKARFDHPTMSTGSMGKTIGYYKNFRKEGDKVKADLHLSDFSAKSPEGDLREYILSRAEEAPGSFANSIVFSMKGFMQKDEQGEYDIFQKDEDGNYLTTEAGERMISKKYDKNKPVFARLDQLHFSDLVDEGAAAPALFHNQESLAVQLTQFLNQHPELTNILEQLDQRGKLSEFKLQEYWQKYQSIRKPETDMNNEQAKGILAKLDALGERFEQWFSGKPKHADEATPVEPETLSAEQQLSAAQEQVAELTSQLNAATARAEAAEAAKAETESSFSELQGEIEALRAEVQALGNQPADPSPAPAPQADKPLGEPTKTQFTYPTEGLSPQSEKARAARMAAWK